MATCPLKEGGLPVVEFHHKLVGHPEVERVIAGRDIKIIINLAHFLCFRDVEENKYHKEEVGGQLKNSHLEPGQFFVRNLDSSLVAFVLNVHSAFVAQTHFLAILVDTANVLKEFCDRADVALSFCLAVVAIIVFKLLVVQILVTELSSFTSRAGGLVLIFGCDPKSDKISDDSGFAFKINWLKELIRGERYWRYVTHRFAKSQVAKRHA